MAGPCIFTFRIENFLKMIPFYHCFDRKIVVQYPQLRPIKEDEYEKDKPSRLTLGGCFAIRMYAKDSRPGTEGA